MSASSVERVTTERLSCERLEPEHADVVAPIMLEPTVLEWLAPGETRTEADVRRSMRGDIEHWKVHGFGIWLVRDLHTGEAVGRGGLRFTDATGQREVEVAWVIVPSRRRQGLATELAGAAVKSAFGPLELDQVIAYTLPHNVASRGVMERAGFTYERDILVDHHQHVVYRRRR
jgi:ribosomal-protein-alanine N-acetyltransferase